MHEFVSINSRDLLKSLRPVVVPSQKLRDPCPHGEIGGTVSIPLIVDRITENIDDVAPQDRNGVTDYALNRCERLTVDGREGGLDVDAMGDAHRHVAVQGHGQSAHIESEDVANGTAEDCLL